MPTGNRYQIFVGSTFEDLQEERKYIHDAILKMYHIPAGMEMFPSEHRPPLEVIHSQIDDSDLYLLVLGSRYGTRLEDGRSYTEAEYDYAIAQKKEVLPFLVERVENRTVAQSSTTPEDIASLRAFRQRVLSAHTVTTWSNKEELKEKVLVAVPRTLARTSALGYVRASQSSETRPPEAHELWYARVAALRGRDFLGPKLRDNPAKHLTILLTLLESDDRFFKYQLEYRIDFERGLQSALDVEINVSPVAFLSGARQQCYRRTSADLGKVVFEFSPLIEVDLTAEATEVGTCSSFVDTFT